MSDEIEIKPLNDRASVTLDGEGKLWLSHWSFRKPNGSFTMKDAQLEILMFLMRRVIADREADQIIFNDAGMRLGENQPNAAGSQQ